MIRPTSEAVMIITKRIKAGEGGVIKKNNNNSNLFINI